MPIIFCVASFLAAAAPADDDTYARERVELGWHDAFTADAGWRREPWHVKEPDDNAAVRFGPAGGAFEVTAPGRAMAWTRTTNPIWVAVFPFLEADYEIVGASGDEDDHVLRLSDGATGPVTPGALNPENPLASGAQARLGPATPGRHHLVVDLRTLFRSDRIAELTLILRSGATPATLTVRRLAFWASDPRQSSAAAATRPTSGPALFPVGAAASTSPAAWKSITLPSAGAIPAVWLARAFASSASWPADASYGVAGIPFRLGSADRAGLATGVMETDTVELTGDWRGCELALLLATRVFGSDRAWYGGQTPPSRGPITSPCELSVRLEYKDGTRRTHFPWSVARKGWTVERLPDAYVVPLDPGKQLVRVELRDAMTYGQVFLLGASINTSDQRLVPALAAEAAPSPSSPPAAPTPRPTCWTRSGDVLTVENAWIELRLLLNAGLDLQSLRLVPSNRTIISATPAIPLLECLDEHGRGSALALRDLQTLTTADTLVLTFVLTAGDPADAHTILFRMQVHDDGRVGLAPTLVNESSAVWRLALCYPQLHGCRVSESVAEAHYLLGTRSTLLANGPVTVDEPYGGAFPLQLMDVFSTRGGGLGLYVTDTALAPKSFQFKQGADGADMTVRFPDIEVTPDSRPELPAVILQPHLGDWHDVYARYRQWLRTAIRPRPPGPLADLFYCRRDYPLGGTGYLFDLRRKRYTLEELIAESSRGFGGIDMIDISGWAYNEALGRVGQYRTNDLGGLPELRRAVDAAHGRGVRVGLYFEGYLIDRRSVLAKDAMPAWQLISKDGRPRWWGGSDKEFFVCPGVVQWRRELSQVVADVAAETGADAVYLDEFGFAGADKACWSPDHGHAVPSNPLVEEQGMLTAVRRALDARSPKTAIYVECVPVDAQMGLVDAAFDYGMTMPGIPRQHVTKLPLVRFLFPELIPVEMVGHGIRPVPVTEGDLHRCVFHGMAVWLKGRADSWYAPGFRETAQRAYRILREHADVFRSADCEPLIPTLRTELYANRFSTAAQTIITLYNARYSDISGDLIRVPLAAGGRVHDLWADRRAEVRRDGNEVVIRGTLGPQSAGAFLLTPPNAAARREVGVETRCRPGVQTAAGAPSP